MRKRDNISVPRPRQHFPISPRFASVGSLLNYYSARFTGLPGKLRDNGNLRFTLTGAPSLTAGNLNEILTSSAAQPAAARL